MCKRDPQGPIPQSGYYVIRRQLETRLIARHDPRCSKTPGGKLHANLKKHESEIYIYKTEHETLESDDSGQPHVTATATFVAEPDKTHEASDRWSPSRALQRNWRQTASNKLTSDHRKTETKLSIRDAVWKPRFQNHAAHLEANKIYDTTKDWQWFSQNKCHVRNKNMLTRLQHRTKTYSRSPISVGSYSSSSSLAKRLVKCTWLTVQFIVCMAGH